MERLFDRNKRELNKLQPLVDKILSLREEMMSFSDAALRNRTWAFRRRLSEGESLDDLLPEAYAVVREAARRVLGMEHFPVQLLGGIVLHQGRIAEMCTGEGKTLVATLPAYLNALTGEGVHVITVNDYLAKRDRELMGKVHEFLGLRVGVVLGGMDRKQRKEAYDCDITYVTNSELGFDYLRDNMAMHPSELVQRGFHYVIIDEVDSVLIDEARMPLIISGERIPNTKLFEACDVLARRMTCGGEIKELSKLDTISGVYQQEAGDYLISEKKRQIFLTEAGVRRVERFFRIESIAMSQNIPIMYHMDLALRANYLMHRDRDYVVKDRKVYIVDEQTGRIAEGRQYSRGLHQAIEAKERVPIQQENRTVATITYQNFFNLYRKLSGMTGTGRSEEQEFMEIYHMDVVTIPTNRPILRQDKPDLFFRTRQEKLEAVCREAIACHASGQPLLVGTASVWESEQLSQMFHANGIHHNLLNAKHHEQEAAIVALAGHVGAVTIATSMAGRGTDIKLDAQSLAAGGLRVIGTERSDSLRVDRQLQGRSGRQGDPGESQFYLSMEDHLIRHFGTGSMPMYFDSLNVPQGQGVVNAILGSRVAQAQKLVESNLYGQRKQMLEYDMVLHEQRRAHYDQRRRILVARDISPVIANLLTRVARDAVESYCESPSHQERQALDLLTEILPPSVKRARAQKRPEEWLQMLTYGLLERYADMEASVGNPELVQARAREILLKTSDRHWMAHLEEMEQLRQGVWLVTYAQKDSLTEYKKTAFDLFTQMNQNILYDTAEALLCPSELKVRL